MDEKMHCILLEQILHRMRTHTAEMYSFEEITCNLDISLILFIFLG